MNDTQKKEEALLLACSKDILHAYYEKNEITMLLAFMAQDITWCGGGSTMIASGRDGVTRFFITTRDKMIPTILSNEQWISHALSDDLWLFMASADVETAPELALFLKEHLKCDFLYRRNPEAGSGKGWELVHLNNSISYNKLEDKETFAVTEGVKDLWLRNHYGTGMMDDAKKEELFRTVNEKVFRYLDEDTKKTLTALSLFDRFSVNKALFMCPDVDVPAILSSQEKSGLFLYLNRQIHKYFFFPLMKEFLQSEFKLWSEEARRQYLDKAAHWYYSMGSLPEAMRFASLAKNYELSLAILDKGTDTILLAGPRMYPADLLDHIPDEIMKKHLKTVILMLYDLYFSDFQGAYRKNLARIQRMGLDTLGRVAMDFLEGTTTFNDLGKMISYCTKAQSAIHRLRAEEEFRAPRLGFCCPSFTTMYHAVPGKYREEMEKLTTLKSIMNDINGVDDKGAWKYYFKAEYSFYTGRFDQAITYLSYLEATEGYREDLSLQIRCLHYRGHLAYLMGNAEELQRTKKQMQQITLMAEPYQALIAHMSLEGFYLIFPGAREEFKRTMKINSSMYYFPACTYLNILEDESLVRPGSALPLLSSAIRHERLAKQRKSILGEIYALLHQAIAYDMQQENTKCTACLQKALKLAEPDHLISPFFTAASRFANTWNRLKAAKAAPKLLKDILAFKDKTARHQLEQEARLRAKAKNLTGREMEIIRLVMAGKKNKDIAHEMNVAEITIKKALSLIYKKLEVQNRAQLVAMFKEK